MISSTKVELIIVAYFLNMISIWRYSIHNIVLCALTCFSMQGEIHLPCVDLHGTGNTARFYLILSFFKTNIVLPPHFYFNVPFPVESGLACYSFRLFSEGFDLPLHTWSVMNRFRTGQGSCRADLRKWGLAQSPSCDCGQRLTMNHIVDMCPLTKFEGGLNLLHKADDEAVMQLESTATAALAK